MTRARGIAADAYVAENGIEHSGGIIEAAFEAGANWASVSIRDYIATAALQGIGTWTPLEPKAPYHHQPDLKGNDALKARAEWSYRQADAMLKARGIS